MTRAMKIVVLIPIGITAIALFTFIGGTAVKLLWNWLLPPLFGFPVLTFWQALGLLALCRILFGGSGVTRGWRRHRLSREERERFRQRVHARWGGDPRPAPSENSPQ